MQANLLSRCMYAFKQTSGPPKTSGCSIILAGFFTLCPVFTSTKRDTTGQVGFMPTTQN
jgi:hypothetical protein